VGRGALGELRKAETPDGRRVAVRLIPNFTPGSLPLALLESARRLKYVHHPGLLPVEEVKADPKRLFLVMQHAEESLRDRFEQCRFDGPGVPRDELVHRLRCAAEALDYLAHKHFLHHLGLKPDNLFLHENRIVVGDYGVIPLIWIAGGQAIGSLNVRYAAPEVAREQPSPASDQYSLALIYHEMLTGRLPHGGTTAQEFLACRQEHKLDLAELPAGDRPILARALNPDPSRRFGNCAELMGGLSRSTVAVVGKRVPEAAPAVSRAVLWTTSAGATPAGVERIVGELVAAAASKVQVQVREYRGVRYHLYADGSIWHQCAAWLPGGVAQYKLKSFLRRWRARLMKQDDDSLVIRVGRPDSWWRRLAGHKGLELHLRLHKGPSVNSKLTAVNVRIRPLGADERTAVLLRKLGPILLEHLHLHLLASPEQRVRERFAFEQPLLVCLEGAGHAFDQGVLCRGKDISTTGLGFLAPFAPALGSRLYVHNLAAGVALPARVTRVQPSADHWFDVGVRFLLDAPPLVLDGSPGCLGVRE